MNSCLISLLILAVSLFPHSTAAAPDQIIELFRHGATSPSSQYDNSWSALGMLTPVGLRQHYVLGKSLAQKYPSIFGSSYNYTQVYSLSSNVPRSIQSASAHLYGIYYGKGPIIKNNYPIEQAVPPLQDMDMTSFITSIPNTEAMPGNFVPASLNTADQTNIHIFKGDHGTYCPNMDTWDSQNRNDVLTKKTFDIFADTVANLNRVLDDNHKIKTPTDLLTFADVMFADIYDNRTLPGGIIDSALITNVTWAYTWFSYHFAQGQQVQKELSAFHIVDAFLDQMSSFRHGRIYNKAVLLSGYDTNIISVLSAFGIINEGCIMENFYSVLKTGTLVYPNCRYADFASNIILELYNSTKAPYVKLYYDSVPVLICSGKSDGKYECPYDEFVSFANDSLGGIDYKDYFQICGDPQKPVVSPEPDTTDWLSIHIYTNVAIGILCVALLMKIVWDRIKFRKEIKEVRRRIRAYEQTYRVKTQLDII